jgi:uncharacterized protein YprB with RNaseH-like and TPR domain
MQMTIRCYLDIETTGISPKTCQVTVVGLALERDRTLEVLQLVGSGITEARLRAALRGVDRIYTYNGRRFDLPFLRKHLGVDLEKSFVHRDLMYDCWAQKLKGGLKKVEEKLGIVRAAQGIDGWMAVQLWWDYINRSDQNALRTLLAYNREDVINLKTLRTKLGVQ